MNYQEYYKNQVNTGLPGFEGVAFQKGYGVGSIFRKFFKWVIPIIKDNALPYLNKTLANVTNEAVTGLNNFTKDVIDDQKGIKESAKLRFNESISNLKRKIQEGSGLKKINNKKKRKISYKKQKCIFD